MKQQNNAGKSNINNKKQLHCCQQYLCVYIKRNNTTLIMLCHRNYSSHCLLNIEQRNMRKLTKVQYLLANWGVGILCMWWSSSV